MTEFFPVSSADGRTIEVADSGPAGAPAILFHHGTPGSANQARYLVESAGAHGLRLVTMSRPGYGTSTRRPGRSVADVVDDVVTVLDALDIDRAYVAGASGGGPHALATAALLPDRVRAALSIAGVAPYGVDDLDFLAGMGEGNVLEFGAALESEQAVRDFTDGMRPGLLKATPAELIEELSSLLPPVDRAVVTGELGEDMCANMRHALEIGVDGWVDDDLAFTLPWGFALSDIRVPVTLWQGGADLMVPFAHGEWLAKSIPGIREHLLPDQGHLSIGIGSMDAMLDELLSLG